MSVELWDVFDENGVPTGKTALRGRSVLAPGEYHLVVHIWVISKSGLFLIQRRADDKKLMPGEWAATGGAAVAGEDSLTAARRELLEELGIAADRDKMLLLTRIKRRNSLLDVWLTESNAPAEKLTLQQTEVAEAKWITGKELKEMIKNGSFHNLRSILKNTFPDTLILHIKLYFFNIIYCPFYIIFSHNIQCFFGHRKKPSSAVNKLHY